MNRVKSILFGLAAVFSLSQCDPYELPEPAGSENPKFFIQGQLNGEDINWKSDGETFLASGFIDERGTEVFGYGSQMKTVNCDGQNDCGPYLQLSIRGNAQFEIDAKPYPYRFLDIPAPIDQYEATIYPEANTGLTSCEWIIDGTETITTRGEDPLVIERDQNDSSTIHIRLISNHTSGCSTEIEDFVYLPHHGCRADIKTKELSALNHILFEAKATGSSAFDYAWRFESGPTASSEEVNYKFNSIPTDGIETVLLEIEGNGCKAQNVRNQVVDSSALCNINFSYDVATTTFNPPITQNPDYGTVEVMYMDEMGNLYRSETQLQPDWVKYEVVEFANDYVDPITGKQVLYNTANLDFSVVLHNEIMGNIELINCTAVLPNR